MHDNIRAVFDWSQQNRRCNRIVDDQWDAVFVCHAGQRLDIADIPRWITDAFAKDCPRLVVDQFFYGVGLIRLREANGDSLIWKNVSEQRVGGAIELRNRDDVTA